MLFPKIPEPLDADEPLGKKYVHEIVLADGDSITAGDAHLVDETSTTVLTTGQLLELSEVAVVQITDASGNVWGISYRARGLGTPGPAYIRFEYTTALGNGDHATRRLIVEQR